MLSWTVLVMACLFLSTRISPITDVFSAPQSDLNSYVPLITSATWGGSWQRVGNEVEGIDKFYSVAVCENHVLAGSDKGVFSLKRPNSVWTHEQSAFSNAPTAVTFVPDNCAIAYSASLGFGVWRGVYNDGDGWDWSRIDKDNHLSGARSVIIVPAVIGSQETIYVAGEFGVMWLPSLPDTPQTWQATNLTSLATSLTTDGGIVASYWNQGVYLRTGDGIWSPLGNSPPADKLVYQAAYDGQKGIVGTQTGAFRLTGGNWERISSIDQTAFSVAVSPLGIFAGMRGRGIVGSSDGGATWLPFDTGIDKNNSEFQVRDLYLPPGNGGKCMLAATTTGIWQWGTCS